jgi:hypothetical protein
MRSPLRYVLVLLVGCLVGAFGIVAPAESTTTPQIVVPPNVTAGVAVFDRQTGTFTEQLNTTMQFRSASLVKLLLLLDFLWNRGPNYDIPAADRSRLDVMLQRSDDAAASHYWSTLGGSAIITRMVSRLGLQNTAPPPSTHPGFWGYVAISAADVVRIYRYILDSAPAPVRDYIMGNLHAAKRCASDTFDQFFGIPGAFEQPWAVKQGWSGFSSGGCSIGGESASVEPKPGTKQATPEDVDLTSEALHTTGTVGENDRSIVAVFTLHPDGTPYATAYSKLNALAHSLNVPGGTPLPGTVFGTWGEGVNVRAEPNTSSAVVAQVPSGVEVLVSCQVQGELVEVPPYSNDWWAYLPQYGGYMTNIYVSNDSDQLPGVPTC